MTDDHTDDRDLRDLLDSTAPDGPDLTPGARVTAVTTRARAVTRRNRIVVAAAVLAVAAGVAVPLALGGDPKGSPEVAADPSSEPAEPGPVPCLPATDVTDAEGTDAPAPDGAVSVRVCPVGEFDGLPASTAGLPQEPVVEDVDVLVDAIEAVQPGPLPDECALTSVAIQPWSIQVGYADGDPLVISGSTRACGQVTVAGEGRNVEDVLAAFTTAAEAQDPAPPPTADCVDDDAAAVIEPTPDTYDGALADFDPVVGAVCHLTVTGEPAYAESTGGLDADQAATIAADLKQAVTAKPTTAERCSEVPSSLSRIVLVDAQWRQVVLVDEVCRELFSGDVGFWEPGEAAQDAIADALGGRTG